MAALVAVLNIILFQLNFDLPDGSTSWGYICYFILVKLHSPNGSIYWVPKYYQILVNFDHPDGSTS